MSIIRSIVVISACSLGFGVAGGLLGVVLGVGAPAYYRGVFRAGDNPVFNPVHVGLGLGLSQGAICGVIVGCVVVLARAMTRPPHPTSKPGGFSTDHVESCHPRSSWIQRGFAVVAILAALACGGVVGFVVGAVEGQTELYQHTIDSRRAKIEPILREPLFAGVEATFSSDASVYLAGTIASQQASKALEERMRFLFGDEEARLMTTQVEVARE